MKPIENQVYDAYPGLIGALDLWAARVDAFPLDDMSRVNRRLVLIGRHVAEGVVTPISQDRLAAHGKLIEAAQAFHAARAEIAAQAAAEREAAAGAPE